jgi:Flp pilus assembly protein TadG
LQTCKYLLAESGACLSRQSLARGKRGSSLVETLAGFAIIIPLGLFAVDLTMVISASQLNERLVEDAARAAGLQGDAQDAEAAAETAINSYQVASPIKSVHITDFVFDPINSQVQVKTNMVVGLPVPVTTLDQVTIAADAVEPITAIPAPP